MRKQEKQEITQERWIAWANRVFERREAAVEFLDEELAKLYGGNVQITISADHDPYEYVTLYFNFNEPPIF
jgi:hypothetical protein